MDLASVLVVVIAFAVVMYVINNFFAVDAKLKTLINIIFLLVFCIWLFTWSGLFYGHHVIVR
jgi:hypothetical protein